MKQMKQILSLLLAVVMVLSMSVSAFAADNGVSIELVPSSAELTVDDEFTVTANVTVNSGFNALDIQLTYDTAVVEFLGFASSYDEDAGEDVLTSDFAAGSLISYNNTDAKIALARTNNSTKTGTLFTANFKAIGEGDANIAYNSETINMTAGDGEAVALTIDTAQTTDLSIQKKVVAADYVIYQHASDSQWPSGTPVYVNTLTLKGLAVNQCRWDGDDCYITLNKKTAADAAFSIAGTAVSSQAPQMISMFSMDMNGSAYTGPSFTYSGSLAEGKAEVVATANAQNYSGTKTFHLTVDGVEAEEYEVTLPSSRQYSIIAEEGSVSPVAAGGSYSFTVSLNEGYKAGENFAVKANDVVLTAVDGIYTIESINAAQTITVEGVVMDIADSGYTVYLTQDSLSKTVGETAVVSLNVQSGEQSSFNSLYAELSYDPAYLTLTTESSSTYEVSAKDGVVKIVAYGADKELGKALDLSFTVAQKPENGTKVTLNKANVDVSSNAAAQNAPAATLISEEVEFSVGAYTVALPDDFIGDTTIAAGEDYSFSVKDKNYDYSITASVDGRDAKVIDNKDGTYTIENVSGNLVITASKTAKSFKVSVVGAQDGQVTYAGSASYLSDYSFNVAAAEGYSTVTALTVGGVEYNGFTAEEGTYTIPGKDITGDIVITITNTASQYTWSFEGSGAGDASTTQQSLSHGETFVFTVNKDSAFNYEITAMMGEKAAEIVTNDDGNYSISAVSGNLVITVNKTTKYVPVVESNEYVKVDDGTVAQTIIATCEGMAEDEVLAYNGEQMYWSDKYNAFVYLVLSGEPIVIDEGENPITVVKGEKISIDYSGDVNGTKAIDVNDAQLVYDIYNAKYESFDSVSMYKFLCADVNGDKVINVSDAAAIVNTIVGNN